jgi:hypothetical protein
MQLFIVLTCFANVALATLTTLNVTAITAANNVSIFQCWTLASPFVVSTQPGTLGSAVLQLGETASSSLAVLPAGFEGGIHRAPVVQ